MHSFQPSRGRILFEFACALGMVASCVGAWKQTGASALLLAAAVTGLYGFVRLLDLSHVKPSQAVEPQRIDFEPATSDIVVPMVLAEEPAAESVVEEAEVVELTPARTGSGRRSGGSRKSGGRRTKAPKVEKAAEPAPVEEMEAPWPVADEPKMAEAAPEEEEFVFPDDGEPTQSHIAPLFEPEPFARMQRRAFGRRGRL